MLKFMLFGPGQAFYNDRLIGGFPNRQSFLLLCYLLLNPHYAHSRDHLATMFWGDYPTHISRKYLRNSIWKLRQELESFGIVLDEYIQVDDESIVFLTNSSYWLDTNEFEQAVIHCQDIDPHTFTIEQANQLESAVYLYHSDLLTGIYADWCLYDRERLFLLYISALAKLMNYYEFTGHYERGLACGEMILSRDNTREMIHLQMMRLYWSLGDRGAALAQYKRCAQILRDELGIAPMKETTHIYQQMVNNQYPTERGVTRSSELVPTHVQNVLAAYQLFDHTLLKLKHLQKIIEEANLEIRNLERIIASNIRNIE